METALIDPALTLEWCQNQQSTPNPQDPLLINLNKRHQSLSNRRHRKFLLGPKKSLLLNRLQHGDPFHNLRTQAASPYITQYSFEEDADFVRDIQSIIVPMLLIVLPKHAELRQGDLLGSKQMISLIQSLKRLTGTNPTFLMRSMDVAEGDIDKLFLLPDDQHPSVIGSDVYARAVVALLIPDNPMR